MAQHPEVALSAYVDDALPPDERAAVEAHLGGCSVCRPELEELRSVRRLLAQLPERAPRRSLLPRLAPPSWLAPARWLSTVAAAVFALVFVASSLPSPLGGGAVAPALAPALQEDASRGVNEPQPVVTPTPPAALRAPVPAPSVADAGKSLTSAASATPRPSPQPRGSALSDRVALAERQAGPPPWMWLVAAIVACAVALTLQWSIARRS